MRLWPIAIGVLSALPLLASSGRHWIQEGAGSVVFGTAFTLAFWMPPFVLLAGLGWTRHLLPHATVRVSSQIAGVIAVVLFPAILVTDAIINPTDAQAGLALLVMPVFGVPSALVGAAIGYVVARVFTR